MSNPFVFENSRTPPGILYSIVLYRGNYTQAEWYFQKLNDIFPGQVIFKWEHSLEGGIFLNVQLFINRETQKVETMYFVKQSNKKV